jgi:hypothetical protein
VRNRSFVALVLPFVLLVAGCDSGLLDPTACYEDPIPTRYEVEEFRIAQLNQHLDNSFPLFAFRDAGARVVIGTNAARRTIGTAHVNLIATDGEGVRTMVGSQSFDCLDTQMAASFHVDTAVVRTTATYEIEVLGPGGVVAEAQAAPPVATGEPFSLVFIPLAVDGGATGSFREGQRERWTERAYAMFPVARTSTVLAPARVSSPHEVQSSEARAEFLSQLREHAYSLADAGELPPRALVVGLIPTPEGWRGTGGRGGGYASVTGDANTTSALDTFLHELGHQLFLPHAEGCGAPGPDPSSSTFLRLPGYDIVERRWKSGVDYMSYCDNESWIGTWALPHLYEAFDRAQRFGTFEPDLDPSWRGFRVFEQGQR